MARLLRGNHGFGNKIPRFGGYHPDVRVRVDDSHTENGTSFRRELDCRRLDLSYLNPLPWVVMAREKFAPWKMASLCYIALTNAIWLFLRWHR
jgi:hypothetical protein